MSGYGEREGSEMEGGGRGEREREREGERERERERERETSNTTATLMAALNHLYNTSCAITHTELTGICQ